MTFPSTTQEDPAAESSHQLATFEQGNGGDQTSLVTSAGINHQNRNNRQFFPFTLTTVLAVASFISLLMPVLKDLPNDIAYVALINMDFFGLCHFDPTNCS